MSPPMYLSDLDVCHNANTLYGAVGYRLTLDHIIYMRMEWRGWWEYEVFGRLKVAKGRVHCVGCERLSL